jgi:4a-hydroxytetrahydrobiopterin dehydratase
MPTLSPEEIAQHMTTVPDWQLVNGTAIERRFAFGSFREAVSYVVRMAFHAEEADHHPDITISYKTVTLSFSTHSEGGLTAKDFEGARKADRVSWV